MLSSKLNVLSHNTIIIGQIWKNSFTNRGCFFSRWSFLVPTTFCYLQNWMLHPIFLFILILFALCLHKPYSLLFKCNFDSLEWQLGANCYHVDLETSSRIKLICVPTHIYWSIPFSAVNSHYFYFSCVCQIYVAEVPIMHFFQLLPSKDFNHHMSTQSEVNCCWGDQLPIWIQIPIHIWVYFLTWILGPLCLLLWSYWHLTLAHCGGGSTLAPAPVPSLSHISWLWRVYSRKMWSGLHFFIYKQLSAAHDWIGSFPSDGQWAKKRINIATKWRILRILPILLMCMHKGT